MEKEKIGEKLRHFIHPALIKILSAQRSFRLEVSGEIPAEGQFIYVANHYCIDDIPTVGEAIGRHTYTLVSDEDRGTLSSLALELNGVVWTNRLDKAERKRSKDALVRHLHLGHSILMYPEATWNLSPNLPMLPMNYGCISISLETGVPILPIYLYFTEEVCRVKINKPFSPSKDKVESIGLLRDIMATSAWNFIEEEKMLSRANLDMNMWEANIQKRYDKYARAKKDPDGVRRYEAQFIYRPKNQTTSEEVFSHLKNLVPCRENAFLFRKRQI